jgi:hypothetical protein
MLASAAVILRHTVTCEARTVGLPGLRVTLHNIADHIRE